MVRDLPLSNGYLAINFDRDYQIRDVYFPHVGSDNHTLNRAFRLGIWVDGQFSWITDGWDKHLHYERDSLLTEVTLYNAQLNMSLRCQDFIHQQKNCYIKTISVENLLLDKRRQVRLFFHQDWSIKGNNIGDAGFYDPISRAVIHYCEDRYFLSGLSNGVKRYSIGAKDIPGIEGTWKDAEDGELANTTVTHGSVDSTICYSLAVKAGSCSEEFSYWIVAGTNLDEVRALNTWLRKADMLQEKKKNRKYWRIWTHSKNSIDKRKESAPNKESPLPAWTKDMYKRSLLILQTQINHNGAILASTDGECLAKQTDHYAYLWPRDGAMIVHALDLAGYTEMSGRFYELLPQLITAEGYFLHKYTANCQIASSWHSHMRSGKAQLPIQIDETALIIWAIGEHYRHNKNTELIAHLYERVVKPAAEFLCRYRDDQTNLPKPSYDLWEERHGVMTYGACTVEAALRSAAKLGRILGEDDRARYYFQEARSVKEAIKEHLFDQDRGCYLRGLVHIDDHSKTMHPDYTADISTAWGLFRFGTFPVHEPSVKQTINICLNRLEVKSAIGGYARYENDRYCLEKGSGADIPGNPWIITQLWLMLYEIEQTKSISELEDTLKHLQWVHERAFESGVLSEQVSHHNGQALSVSPLTWSHSTVVETINLYIQKREQLKEHKLF